MYRRSMAQDDLVMVRAEQGTTCTLSPRGVIDIASAPDAGQVIDAALQSDAETVLLDLAEVTFLDSTGLHLLLRAEAQARARGVRLVLLPGPPAVQRVFDLAGCSPRFVQHCPASGPRFRLR